LDTELDVSAGGLARVLLFIDTNHHIISLLKPDSEKCSDIQKDFATLINNPGWFLFRAHCFYEVFAIHSIYTSCRQPKAELMLRCTPQDIDVAISGRLLDDIAGMNIADFASVILSMVWVEVSKPPGQMTGVYAGRRHAFQLPCRGPASRGLDTEAMLRVALSGR